MKKRNLTVVMATRMTKPERESVRAAAAMAGVTPSTFIRTAVLRAARRLARALNRDLPCD